jgi:hypothetical protein
VPDVENIGEDLRGALAEMAEAAGVELGAEAPAPEPEPEAAPRPEPVAEVVQREVEQTGPAGGPPPPEPDAELVAEAAEPGAEEGAGPQIHVSEPWPGYDGMRAPDLIAHFGEASEEALGVVRLYEATHRGRREVMDAAERALARRQGAAR